MYTRSARSWRRARGGAYTRSGSVRDGGLRAYLPSQFAFLQFVLLGVEIGFVSPQAMLRALLSTLELQKQLIWETRPTLRAQDAKPHANDANPDANDINVIC